jgi:hypothetical protein
MSIFSRRNLFRILSQNAQFVRQRQLSEHINRLNGRDPVQRVTTEWETVVLNGLSKFGNVEHEPRLPGTTKPDVLFIHSLGTALMDITAVSDRGLDQQNPVNKLSERLLELVKERGLNSQHFNLQVKGNWRDLRIGGPKPRLSIPRKKDFDTAIFDKGFHRFLDDIRSSRGLKRDFSVAKRDVQVTITYDPAQKYFLMNHLAYTVPFSATQNTIYASLEEKAIQLRSSQFNGTKGIVLCDGGCDALNRRGRRGLDLDSSDIISTFLSDHRSVDFVVSMLIKGDRSGRSGPDHLRILAKGYLLRRDSPAAPLVAYLCEHLPLELPNPENTAINAYGLENEGKSFNGGGTMSGRSIKMSSRAVMGLLSGQTNQEDFMRENPHVKERFTRALSEGRVLEAAKIESCPERDDDWIEFTFRSLTPQSLRFVSHAGNRYEAGTCGTIDASRKVLSTALPPLPNAEKMHGCRRRSRSTSPSEWLLFL